MEKFLKSIFKSLRLNESTISTIVGAFIIIIIGFLIFNYFKTQKPSESDLEIVQDESVKEEPGKVEFIKSEEGELVPNDLPTTHRVAAGEDLWHIAEKYYISGFNWVDIAKENKLANADYLQVGQELKIPKTKVRQPIEKIAGVTVTLVQKSQAIQGNKYKVQKGDYLWDIAVRAYGDGYKWPEIAKANSLLNPDYIEDGQELVLPR